MIIGVLTLHVHIPGCTSLKEKRKVVKPLIIRLQKEFNLSTAEIDRQDAWQEALIACAIVSNDKNHVQRKLQRVIPWVEKNRPDISIVDDHIEIIQ